jgi:hypothetical protein
MEIQVIGQANRFVISPISTFLKSVAII